MKKTFTKWLIPVCLLIIIFTQLLTYYTKNEINGGLLIVVPALMPAALKSFELKNISVKLIKSFEWAMVTIAVVGLIYVLWATM